MAEERRPQRAYDWARQVGTSAVADMLTARAERDDLSERMKSLVAKDTELVSENHKLADRNNRLREVLLIAKLALVNTNALDDDTIQLVRDRIKNELSNQ